jgi:tetratricopeptide (TPR) repeat protein
MSGWFYSAYFFAGRYEDALRIIDKQPVETRTKFGWLLRAASYAALKETDKARAAADEALKHYPDLTAEGIANEPGSNDTDRKKLAEAMRGAGFPACAPAEKLAGIVKPFRLPECSATPAP